MKVYLLLDLVVLMLPLLLSFEPRVRYYRKWPYLFPAIISVGAMFFFWDVLAVAKGDWGFNVRYLLGSYLAGVPLEEIIFYVVVPYSCIFIYEVLAYFRPDRRFRLPSWFFYLITSILFLGALVFQAQSYTTTVLSLCALSVWSMTVAKPQILHSQNYWIFIGVTFVPFLLVNYVLTSLPVVVYSPLAIWGLRVGTIPLEDFFYSYTLLSLNFLLFSFFEDQTTRREKIRNLAQELLKARRMV